MPLSYHANSKNHTIKHAEHADAGLAANGPDAQERVLVGLADVVRLIPDSIRLD
jgi:hypothetical protein